jgi:hypothetical protein
MAGRKRRRQDSDPPQLGHQFRDIQVSGDARVHLGDTYDISQSLIDTKQDCHERLMSYQIEKTPSIHTRNASNTYVPLILVMTRSALRKLKAGYWKTRATGSLKTPTSNNGALTSRAACYGSRAIPAKGRPCSSVALSTS